MCPPHPYRYPLSSPSTQWHPRHPTLEIVLPPHAQHKPPLPRVGPPNVHPTYKAVRTHLRSPRSTPLQHVVDSPVLKCVPLLQISFCTFQYQYVVKCKSSEQFGKTERFFTQLFMSWRGDAIVNMSSHVTSRLFRQHCRICLWKPNRKYSPRTNMSYLPFQPCF